ncbi:MAG: hypothetical protein R2815_00210 [Flavobacteriales bacterium]
MSRNVRKRGTAGLVITGLVGITLIAGAVFLGPRLAWSIASSAVASTVLDGLAEGPDDHQLPVIELLLEEAGGKGTEAHMLLEGTRYPVRVTTPEPLDEDPGVYELDLLEPPDMLPFRRCRLFRPASTDMLQEHMALWLAGDMGVAVPFDALVFLRVDGRDAGVMQLREMVGPELEQARGRSPLAVKVIDALEHGDHVARKVIALPQDTVLTRYAVRDSLERHVNIDACVRLLAVQRMLNATVLENAWVTGGADGRIYPVLTAASLMDGPAPDSAATGNALFAWIEEDAELRARRDRYLEEARKRYVEQEVFAEQWRQEERALMPSLLQDRSKMARIVEGHPYRYGYSVRRAVRSSTASRNTAIRYWMDMAP